MPNVTRLLSAIEAGDPHAAEQLLPLVYDELRKLAAQKLAHEKPGLTLDATALVHEAYLRLVPRGSPSDNVSTSRTPEAGGVSSGRCDASWANRGHFFAAAAEAMRRILIENVRRRKRRKRGGGLRRVELDSAALVQTASPDELLLIDDAIEQLGREDPQAAQLVKLRYFAGLSIEAAAESVGLSRSTAYEHWAYARAWLFQELYGSGHAG